MTLTEKIVLVPIAALSTGSQHRMTDTKSDDLDRLVVAYQTDADSVPPLRVYARGADAYDVVGGHLRYEAAKKAGLTHVRVVVVPRPDTNDGELWDSFVDNARHGRPPSFKERCEAAVVFKRLNPKMSATTIAERVGLSRHSVEDAIHPKDRAQPKRTRSVASLCQRFIAAWDALKESGFDGDSGVSKSLSDAFWATVKDVASADSPDD